MDDHYTIEMYLLPAYEADLILDPYWIRIQSGQWIRIRIRNPDSDPDPGGQKLPTKVEKIRISRFDVLDALF
jgi:hypothetical protein